MKTTWEAPRLIVLAGCRPQESVLTSRKSCDGPDVGPNHVNNFCASWQPEQGCPNCSIGADS